MKKANNRHHEIPRSRLHCSRRTVEIPSGFHTALHCVFGNLFRDEMVEFIKELNLMMENHDKITGKDLEALRDKVKGRVK